MTMVVKLIVKDVKFVESVIVLFSFYFCSHPTLINRVLASYV